MKQKMRTIFLPLFAILISSTIENPLETTTTQSVFVLSALEHHEEVPENAIEVKPDKIHTDIPDDHILKKKIIAMPLSDVQKDTKVLTNDQGHAILAHSTDTSDEDMNTAESSLVFRPLFSYRRKQSSRRRYYVPKGTYNYREQAATNQEYVPNCNRRKHYSPNNVDSYNRPYRQTSYRYPDWYHNAEFPSLI